MRASKLRRGVRKARESPQARSEGEARNLLDILRGVIRQGGETLWVFPMLMLLGVFRFIRGDFQAARRLAEEGLRIAKNVQDQDLLLTEHVLLGMVCLYRGELIAARGHLEKVIARYDLEKHRAVAFRYENDPGVTAL